MKYFDKRYKDDKKIRKYKSGQPKIADYYVSIAELMDVNFDMKEKDLFCTNFIVCDWNSIRTS